MSRLFPDSRIPHGKPLIGTGWTGQEPWLSFFQEDKGHGINRHDVEWIH